MKGVRINRRVALIGLSVVLILLSAAVAILLAAKGAADDAASTSVRESNQYLTSVIGAAEGFDEPQDMLKGVRAISPPVFHGVLFGEISSSYRDAKAFHDEVSNEVGVFIENLEGYAQVIAFKGTYRGLAEKIASLEATVTVPGGRTKDGSYLEAHHELLKDVMAAFKDTKVPSDFNDNFIEFGRVYASMELNWEAIAASAKINSQEAYDNAFAQYDMASAQVPRVQANLDAYISTIPRKVAVIIDTLKQYRSEV